MDLNFSLLHVPHAFCFAFSKWQPFSSLHFFLAMDGGTYRDVCEPMVQWNYFGQNSATNGQSNVIISLQSIERAHKDLAPGKVYFSQGDLTDASVNRSPYAYDQNPEEEKAQLVWFRFSMTFHLY